MPLVSSSIPNLINGVSQQQYTLRLPSQAEEQINGFSTTASGLVKRPPTNLLGQFDAFPAGKVKIHSIHRDSTEKYKVVISNGDLKVYNFAGIQQVVAFPEGKSYLNTLTPDTSINALTLADYTFILNKERVVVQSGVNSPAKLLAALVNVKVGNYGKTYRLRINGTEVASYTTPNGSTAADAPMLSTEYIANQLLTGLTAAGISANISGSVIYLTKAVDFTITGEDGFNGNAMDVVKDITQRFATLPPKLHVNGFKVQVAGDPTNKTDNYWVEYQTTSTDRGVWRETVAPNTSNGVNYNTMPHILTREADGTFLFRTAVWDTRKVGDMETAPDPSFVLRNIEDMFFYRNRLGFLSGDSLVMSEAGEFFNFFPATVTATLDSDPIDITVSHNKVPNLLHVAPFDKKLLLFSNLAQFSLESGELLTPKSVSTPLVTEFECSPVCKPAAVGNNVYFPVSSGGHSLVREYYAEGSTGKYSAANVSEHIPTYLPRNITKMVSATNMDLLALFSPDTLNTLYIYKFYWNNAEKLQSSWSKWVLSGDAQILDVEYLDSKLYLVVRHLGYVSLECLDLSLAAASSPEPFSVCLDRKQFIPAVNATYAAGKTQLLSGFFPGAGSHFAVVAEGQRFPAGSVIPMDSFGKLQGDYSNCAFYVGTAYDFTYTFSTLSARIGGAQQGSRVDTIAKLQLRYMQLNYAASGAFNVSVASAGKFTYTYKYTGKHLGPAASLLGAVSIGGGVFRFAALGKNTEMTVTISSLSPLPCSFLSADWEGFYEKRSRSM